MMLMEDFGVFIGLALIGIVMIGAYLIARRQNRRRH